MKPFSRPRSTSLAADLADLRSQPGLFESRIIPGYPFTALDVAYDLRHTPQTADTFLRLSAGHAGVRSLIATLCYRFASIEQPFPVAVRTTLSDYDLFALIDNSSRLDALDTLLKALTPERPLSLASVQALVEAWPVALIPTPVNGATAPPVRLAPDTFNYLLNSGPWARLVAHSALTDAEFARLVGDSSSRNTFPMAFLAPHVTTFERLEAFLAIRRHWPAHFPGPGLGPAPRAW